MLYFDMSFEKITTFSAPFKHKKTQYLIVTKKDLLSAITNDDNIDFGLNKCKTLLENNFKKYELISFKKDIQRIQLKTGEQNCSNFIEALNQVLIFYSLGQQISQNHACIFHLQSSKISSKDANTKKIIIKQQKPQ